MCRGPCVSPAVSLKATCCFCFLLVLSPHSPVYLGGAHNGLLPLAHTPGLLTTSCCSLT